MRKAPCCLSLLSFATSRCQEGDGSLYDTAEVEAMSSPITCLQMEHYVSSKHQSMSIRL